MKRLYFFVTYILLSILLWGQEQEYVGRVLSVEGNITYTKDSKQEKVTTGMLLEKNMIFERLSDNGSVRIFVVPDGEIKISRFPATVSGEPFVATIAGATINSIGGSVVGNVTSSSTVGRRGDRTLDFEDLLENEDFVIEAISLPLIRSGFTITLSSTAREIGITEESLTIPLPLDARVSSIQYKLSAVQNDLVTLFSSGELEQYTSDSWLFTFPHSAPLFAHNEEGSGDPVENLLVLSLTLANGSERTFALRYYVPSNQLFSQVMEEINQAKARMSPAADTDILEAMILWSNGLTIEAVQFLQGKNKDWKFLLGLNQTAPR